MCLIVVRPKNKLIPYEKFKQAIENNPDGYGLTYPEGDGKKMRTLRSAEKAVPDDLYRLIQDELKDVDIMLHLRYTTAGETVLRNAHPFPILNYMDDGIDLRMAHNGTIYRYKNSARNGESDTRCFARTFVRPLLSRINKGMYSEDFLKDEFVMGLIKDQIPSSSVLTFMDAEGNTSIINPTGNGGFYDDGVYYSNKYSFKSDHRTPVTPTRPSVPANTRYSYKENPLVDATDDYDDYKKVTDRFKVGDKVKTQSGLCGVVESTSYGWVEVAMENGSEIYCMEYTLELDTSASPEDDEEETDKEELFYQIISLTPEELVSMTSAEIGEVADDPDLSEWMIEHMQETIKQLLIYKDRKEAA